MSFRDRVIAGAPDPEDASRRVDRLLDAAAAAGVDLEVSGADAATVAALACQRAPYLATLLARDPQRLERVAADPYLRRQKSAEAMSAELAERLAGAPRGDVDVLHRELRRFRADELVRLGARELSLGTPVEVGCELAHLADACLGEALAFHRALLVERYGPPRFRGDDGLERDAEAVVIGMGKLGGEELNFSSDIDVVYVYSSDQGSAGELSLHEFFAKLFERVTAAIGEVTSEDCVFKVDLRLRPEGSRGAIANSLPSMERYYETFGRPWERQAWLKARACAGSGALGREVMETLRPFIYPRSTSPHIIDEVEDLNRRIKAELIGGGVESGFDLKNGVGGIREVEFFVQALQLIHAGPRPLLRSRSTMGALDQLLFAGLISEAERRSLALAYRFLRHLEHVIQLETGRQTQRMPSDPAALELLARRVGLASAGELQELLDHHTRGVAESFSTLGSPEPNPGADVQLLLRGHLDAEAEVALLASMGFRDPEAAAAELTRARNRPSSPLNPGVSGTAHRVAPAFLQEIADSPDPDQALRYASELISRRGAWSSIWGFMEQLPAFTRLVASLFGTSDYLSKLFVDHPEQVDALVTSGTSHSRHSAAELASRLARRLERTADDDEEARWDALAEFKNREILRIGLADIGGDLDAEETCAELSTLADICLGQAWADVTAALSRRHGSPRDGAGQPVGIAALALGKLGGRELGYASDLDLIFVYRDEGETDGPRPIDNASYATKVAQRLMSSLHALHRGGRLYEVDTRLRPSGTQGLLVSTLASWHRYHEETSRLWEHQALTKLRPVAGDAALGAAVAASVCHFIYRDGRSVSRSPRDIAEGIVAMRDRIRGELLGRELGRDVKVGRGGLIDIEFCAQYLQLAFGAHCPSLRTPSTTAALRAAAEAGVIDKNDSSLLVDGYRFLRHIEHRLRIVHDRSEHRLPTAEDELDKLARRAGYPDGKTLTSAFERWSEEVLRASEAVMGRAPAL